MTHYAPNDNETLCGASGTVVTKIKDITCLECKRLATFSPFTYLNAFAFFRDYAPGIPNRMEKLAGTPRRGKARGFTDADKDAIRAGLDKFIDALKNAVIGLIIASCVMACSKDNPRPRPTPEEVQAKPVPKDTLTATADPDFAVPGK